MDESRVNNHLEDIKTDETELDALLSKYDLDEALEVQYNNFTDQLRDVQLTYQTLLTTRHYHA